MTEITLKGSPIHTNGQLPAIGAPAPDFRLVGSDLGDKQLKDFLGKKLVISTVPSLDTAVCATATKKFNESVKNATVLVVSADLPFAQKRFCEAEKAEHIHPLSMMRSKAFAKDYGVLIEDGPLEGLCARSIIVVDESGKVIYTELVPEITQEPNYEAVLQALSS